MKKHLRSGLCACRARAGMIEPNAEHLAGADSINEPRPHRIAHQPFWLEPPPNEDSTRGTTCLPDLLLLFESGESVVIEVKLGTPGQVSLCAMRKALTSGGRL